MWRIDVKKKNTNMNINGGLLGMCFGDRRNQGYKEMYKMKLPHLSVPVGMLRLCTYCETPSQGSQEKF
jgi:hypothetical protein